MHPLRHFQHRLESRTAAALILALLLVVTSALASITVATDRASATAGPAALAVSPSNYVGGQALTWTGDIGHPGERTLELQFNMGSVVGNHWSTVDGFEARTRSDGSFSFTYPAPSMFNIRYRVTAGRLATPAQLFQAKTPDLTIRVTGQADNYTNEPGQVDDGQSFGITVDTTPDNIFRNPGSQGLPVFRGRVLTLQKRVSATAWGDVATTTVGRDGSGYFTDLEAGSGITVYRVRQEDYLSHGNEIGWTQSFPLSVLVGQDAQDWYIDRYGLNQPAVSVPAPSGHLGAQPQTASQRYSWFPAVFDFAWEYGQSLSSPPSRGTRLTGSWVDSSSGSGRVSKYNGGLAIDSKRYAGAGAGDFGTTSATLLGNDLTYGRWETSMRIRNSFERRDRDYESLAELVPARAADYDCGAHNITIASISPYSRRVQFGVRTQRYQWSGHTKAPYTPLSNAYNVAVEVDAKHITWFLNGSPVASVASPEAVPGIPMTVRLSLRGQGDDEMNQTSLISDWQRGFPITSGQGTVSRKLKRADAPGLECRSAS